MNDQWSDLAEAVIVTAGQDYIDARKMGANKTAEKLERFFRGPVFAKISDMDPEYLIARCREKAAEKE